MPTEEILYTFAMNSAMAHTLNKAVELLMRLKLSQFEELPFALVGVTDPKFCEKRDNATPYLKAAFCQLYAGKSQTDWKDDEWYRLYDLLQVIRYQIHQAEHPDSWGVDGNPPVHMSQEPMPVGKWERRGGDAMESA